MQNTALAGVAVAGVAVVGILLLYTARIDAAPDEDLMNFCMGAPELCTFVCVGRYLGCPGLSSSDGFTCESRRGNLVVIEGAEIGGGRSYHEHDYSLCYHNGRHVKDYAPPNPEHEWVPRWENDPKLAMCRGCSFEASYCQSSATAFNGLCVDHYRTHYSVLCDAEIDQNGHAFNRHGRPISPSSACRGIEFNADGDEADPSTRGGRARQGRKWQECRQKLEDACVADHAESHPGDTTENTIRLSVKEIGPLKVEAGFEHRHSIRWGGSIGYRQAAKLHRRLQWVSASLA